MMADDDHVHVDDGCRGGGRDGGSVDGEGVGESYCLIKKNQKRTNNSNNRPKQNNNPSSEFPSARFLST